MKRAGNQRWEGWRPLLGDRTARSIVAVVVSFALVAAACGSTVPQTELEAAAGDEFGDLGTGTLPPGAHINEKGQVVNAQGEVIGTTTAGVAGGSVPAGATGTTGGTSVSPGVNGPGVTDRSITLGLQTVANSRSAQEALGVDVGAFDFKRGWEALLKYQNARGGIAGRQVKPVFWTFDATSSQTFSQKEQEQCATWTEDHQVFAGLTAAIWTTNILKCMQDAGAALISMASGSTLSSTPLHRQYPYFVEPITLDLDRAAKAMVEGLHRMGYFTGDAKLGLVTYDLPTFKYAAEHGLMPALRRRGIDLAASAYLHYPRNFSEIGQLSREAANAALRFKTEDIDHVVFIGGSYYFMLAAERQDYRPRYGLSSLDQNQGLVDSLGRDARSQLRGALSIGWIPLYNTREEDDPDAKNPTRVRCLSIMRKAGVGMSGRAGKLGAQIVCDALWSLDAALHGAKVINQSSFLAGVNGLRGGYSPATVWSTYLDRTQHDGVSSVANLRFVDSCTCFKYLSRPYRVP